MPKAYKITYSFFENTQLKRVNFHGVEKSKLYIRITFNRETTNLKSGFFEKYLQDKYYPIISENPESYISLIKEKETEVIQFIIRKLGDKFDLVKFKSDYDYFTADIFDALEERTFLMLRNFLDENEMPNFSRLVFYGQGKILIEALLKELEQWGSNDWINAFITYCADKGNPYFMLLGVLASEKIILPHYLPRYSWESSLQKVFGDYIDLNYPKFSSTFQVFKH